MTVHDGFAWTDRATTSTVDPATEEMHIGGWLILPALGLIFGPVYTVLMSLVIYDFLKHPAPQAALAQQDFFRLCLEFSACYGLFQLFVAYFFFSRRTMTPWLMIVMYLANLLITFVTACGMRVAIPWYDPTGALFGTLVGALIWIPYFLSSKRVAQTFVR